VNQVQKRPGNTTRKSSKFQKINSRKSQISTFKTQKIPKIEGQTQGEANDKNPEAPIGK
jgi:hypothetical protein